jgi:hypothetical protein
LLKFSKFLRLPNEDEPFDLAPEQNTERLGVPAGDQSTPGPNSMIDEGIAAVSVLEVAAGGARRDGDRETP